jgi:hypothetical protein
LAARPAVALLTSRGSAVLSVDVDASGSVGQVIFESSRLLPTDEIEDDD